MSGKLFIVATPIGNMSDVTFRAIDILKQADLIACEDTRVTVKLLNRYDIRKPLISIHQHTKEEKIVEIIETIKKGDSVAVVTDAGTPGVSDPGGLIVREARKNGIKIEAIPGPSALAAAISVSGFDMKEFVFIGFLPQKKGRRTLLDKIVDEEKAVIIYESPYRIKKLLNELKEKGYNRNIFVGRELTKKFEEHLCGKIEEVVPKISEKGEFVVILEKK
jgi:16S rRNA (cytidine1402-2'-O)-methyltransferase